VPLGVSVEDAKARIRDAQFDLDHCRIAAPFTGRMGTHLVSVGNLIAGSRTATSPTTLLATLVSLDPIYLDFDMSESDFLTYIGMPNALLLIVLKRLVDRSFRIPGTARQADMLSSLTPWCYLPL
jgi:multidrug efflux pump subunit AcrA (membrane-fusion protein)